jgi:hypothetical protein
MEIVKQNETFVLSDVTDSFVMNGFVTYDEQGSADIHFNLQNVNEEHLGTVYYTKTANDSVVNFNINCSEDNRNNLTAYVNTLIPEVLAFNKKI